MTSQSELYYKTKSWRFTVYNGSEFDPRFWSPKKSWSSIIRVIHTPAPGGLYIFILGWTNPFKILTKSQRNKVKEGLLFFYLHVNMIPNHQSDQKLNCFHQPKLVGDFSRLSTGFMKLLDNYERSTGVAERVTTEEVTENNSFLDAILDTAVMKVQYDSNFTLNQIKNLLLLFLKAITKKRKVFKVLHVKTSSLFFFLLLTKILWLFPATTPCS